MMFSGPARSSSQMALAWLCWASNRTRVTRRRGIERGVHQAETDRAARSTLAGGITNLVVFNGQWCRQDHPATLYSALYKGPWLILDGQRACQSRLRAWLAQGGKVQHPALIGRLMPRTISTRIQRGQGLGRSQY